MDILDTLPTLSIAELRKVLMDNDIKEFSGTNSKEDLIHQVSDILLTNMMIKDTMENEQPMDEKTILREQQDRDYEKSVQDDLMNQSNLFMNQDYSIKQPVQLDKDTGQEIFEELSPRSLREKRMNYYM